MHEIQDSGKRQGFNTGAVRDTQDNKPRYDLIPPTSLYRIAMHYSKGAKKYDEFNWAKGMPLSRFIASLFRHLMAWIMGDRSEDHLAAICFNAMSVMHFEDTGRTDLDDMNKRLFPDDDTQDIAIIYNSIQQIYGEKNENNQM